MRSENTNPFALPYTSRPSHKGLSSSFEKLTHPPEMLQALKSEDFGTVRTIDHRDSNLRHQVR